MNDTRMPDCPRCGHSLMMDQIREALATLDVLRCSSCEGLSLAAGDLEKVDDVIVPRLIELRFIPGRAEQHEPLPCPICEPPPAMDKFEHERDHKVVVDRCPKCRGVWLDGGELQAIQNESLPVFLVNTIRYFKDVL